LQSTVLHTLARAADRGQERFPTTIGDGAITVELAHQVIGHSRQSKSLKLAGLASDLADRSCLVAKGLGTRSPAKVRPLVRVTRFSETGRNYFLSATFLWIEDIPLD
jgi:hypothetical protein